MYEQLTKCPVCGGQIVRDSLYQYSIVTPMGKRGKFLSKQSKPHDNGPMEVASYYCVNKDFITDYEGNVVNPTDAGYDYVEEIEGMLFLIGD